MKDVLQPYRLGNLWPTNPTHTHYSEFMKMPHTGLSDENCLFNDIKKKFKIMNEPLSTIYWENDDGE